MKRRFKSRRCSPWVDDEIKEYSCIKCHGERCSFDANIARVVCKDCGETMRIYEAIGVDLHNSKTPGKYAKGEQYVGIDSLFRASYIERMQGLHLSPYVFGVK